MVNEKNKKKFLKIVRESIDKHKMVGESDSVLVAVSGGADSVALLYCLIDILGRDKVCVAHFNHMLRGEESDRDEAFVRDLSLELKVPFYTEKEDVNSYKQKEKLSLEEAARILRYSFLEKICVDGKYNKIATAHHSDDSAELILMNMLRGSGQKGLSGIPPVRGNIIRPFTGVSRKEIMLFLGDNPHVTDSSNSDLRILRNRVRHELIPFLSRNYNPSISNTLNRLGDILKLDGDYLEQVTDEIFNKVSRQTCSDEIIIDIAKINDHHDAIKMRLIRRSIQDVNGNLRRFTNTHIKDVLNILEKSGEKKLDLPSKVRITKRKGDLVVKKHTVPLRSLDSCNDQAPYEFEVFDDSKIEVSSEITMLFHTQKISDPRIEDKNTIYLDKDKLTFPLKVRRVRFGDSFSPRGFSGTQKIKKYFNSNGVPEKKRWITPVLLNNQEIIWLCGHRMGGNFHVTDKTRVVYKIELSLA